VLRSYSIVYILYLNRIYIHLFSEKYTAINKGPVELKRTTNEQGLMGPSDGWITMGWGVLLIEHETSQSLINLFFKKMLGEGVKKIPRTYHFSVSFEYMYRSLLNFSVIFS
jgi:hypothetical protein